MSAAILERARAFEMIANHLPDDKRKEIAEAIGDKILAEVGGTKSSTASGSPQVVAPVVDTKPFDDVVAFLEAHGLEGVELVKAAARVENFLKSHRELTREAGMRVWLATERNRP